MYSSADTGGFMSLSFLFLSLVGLAFGLLVIAFRWKDMLLSYAAALTWMAIGFWWILGDITNFGLDDSWSKILIFVPFILAFTVLLNLMNTEIRMEARGGQGSRGSQSTQSWTERGASPRRREVNRTVEYRKMLRKRLRR